MKAQEITESPQYIADTDFNLDDDVFNMRTARTMLADGSKRSISRIHNASLYTIGNTYALILDNPKRIIYHVRFKDCHLGWLGVTATQQILLWADLTYAASNGMAKDMFFGLLMDRNGAMISDGQQTDLGKRFWDKRVNEALSRGMFVYYAHIMGEHKLIRINSDREYNDIIRVEDVWGWKHKYQPRRIMIANYDVEQEAAALRQIGEGKNPQPLLNG